MKWATSWPTGWVLKAALRNGFCPNTMNCTSGNERDTVQHLASALTRSLRTLKRYLRNRSQNLNTLSCSHCSVMLCSSPTSTSDVHGDAASWAHTLNVVAQVGAAVASAAEAQTTVKGVSGAAPIRKTLLLGIYQRIYEQVH
ncbi:hypothetical protein JZ751_014185 [Albula glossodonta]|uniref:Uncharacterized protein n=1 Tax=Albula glossodonta TaxID=121402 RepID=A0A8T2NUN0_9TELE|nr:hypothetical protein JZ751_014185 [Albula glossodonta]